MQNTNTVAPTQSTQEQAPIVAPIATYESGKTFAPSGYVLSTVHFKVIKETTKDNPLNAPIGTKPASKYVALPIIKSEEIAENNAGLEPHIISMLQDTRELILRESVVQGATSIDINSMSVYALVKWMDENASSSDSSGNKVTKELIAEWFNTSVNDSLAIAIASKLGITESTSEDSILFKNLDDMLTNYKNFFSKLVNAKSVLSDVNIKSLEVALKLSGLTSDNVDNDRITNFVFSKLANMKDKPKADLMALDIG